MFAFRWIIVFLLFFSILETTQSAPVEAASPVPTSEFEPGWVPGPSTRGTLVILFSCILTLVLCVWTTVHANIEPEMWQGGGKLNQKKLIWSMVTLLIPEIALCVAAHERKTAHLLRKEMRAFDDKYQDWDLTLAYYALMGGFVIEREPDDRRNSDGTWKTQTQDGMSPVSSNFGTNEYGLCPVPHVPTLEPENHTKAFEKRCTLTPYGVLRLAELGRFPNTYNSKTVADKSKASFLAKFLVCFQAIWIIIQVAGRYASRIPVTLLELYTVLHTICAIAMYLIWIDKPFDVNQPTFVPVTRADVHALLEPKKNSANTFDNEAPIHIAVDELLHKVGDEVIDRGQHSTPGSVPRHQVDELLQNEEIATSPTNVFWNHGYTECLTKRAGLGKQLFRQLWNWEDFKRDASLTANFQLLLGAYLAIWSGWKKFGWESVALSLVGLAYGGLHCVAWNYQFPSAAERRMWKISSLLTAGFVSIFCFSVLVGYLGNSVWESINKKMKDAKNETQRLKNRHTMTQPSKSALRWTKFTEWLESSRQMLIWLSMVMFCIVVVIAGIPCVVARVYLLVESFISMRKLPKGSYDVVMWGTFLPHFG